MVSGHGPSVCTCPVTWLGVWWIVCSPWCACPAYSGCGIGLAGWCGCGCERAVVVVSGVREFIGMLRMYERDIRLKLGDVVSGDEWEMASLSVGLSAEQNGCCRQLLWSEEKAHEDSWGSGRWGKKRWPRELPGVVVKKKTETKMSVFLYLLCFPPLRWLTRDFKYETFRDQWIPLTQYLKFQWENTTREDYKREKNGPWLTRSTLTASACVRLYNIPKMNTFPVLALAGCYASIMPYSYDFAIVWLKVTTSYHRSRSTLLHVVYILLCGLSLPVWLNNDCGGDGFLESGSFGDSWKRLHADSVLEVEDGDGDSESESSSSLNLLKTNKQTNKQTNNYDAVQTHQRLQEFLPQVLSAGKCFKRTWFSTAFPHTKNNFTERNKRYIFPITRYLP